MNPGGFLTMSSKKQKNKNGVNDSDEVYNITEICDNDIEKTKNTENIQTTEEISENNKTDKENDINKVNRKDIVVKKLMETKEKAVCLFKKLAEKTGERVKQIKLKNNGNDDEKTISEETSENKKAVRVNLKTYSVRAIPVVVVLAVVVMICGFIQKNANEVLVNGVKVAVTANTEMTENQIYDKALEKLKNDKGINVEVNEKITLVPVHASSDEMMSDDEVTQKVADSFTYQVEAVCVYVDGEKTATLKNKEEAESIFEKIKKSYYKEGRTVLQTEFVEDISVKTEFVNSKDIVSDEDAFNIFTENIAGERKYTIKEGDTLWGIAQNAGMSLDELLKANSGMTEDSILQLDSEINLVVAVPRVSVKTVEDAQYTDVAPREVITVENANEYKTYKKVLEEGADGVKTITARITNINGVEESREIVKEEITKAPVAQKIEIGTMQTPPKKAVGSFKYPVYGRLSSGFGARWGRSHKGIDLAAPYGSSVYASDGGTVTFAGWNSGGYGYLVIIDHENGYQTYYGHNSSLAVSAGERVYQGQVVAYVGSTGDSTGNHVHFEVRKNGVPQNPMGYL